MRTYLNLPERLSQTWINQWTILFTISCLKIYLFQLSLKSSIDDVSFYTDVVCDDINTITSSLTQVPLQMSSIANNFVVLTVNALTALRVKFLVIFVTILEYIIIFYVEILYGTFTCLLTAAINGTVDVAFGAADSIIVAVNLTMISAAHDIQQGLNGLTLVINSLTNAYNSVVSFFEGSNQPSSTQYVKQINLTVSFLQNFKIPSSVTNDINSLKTEIPTFSTNYTSSFIESIFDELKTEITIKLSRNVSDADLSSALHFDYSNMTNATKICNDPNELKNIYLNIANSIHKISNWIMMFLILMAVFALIPYIFMEWRLWRRENLIIESMQDLSKNAGSTTTQILLGTLNRFTNFFIYYIVKFFSPSSQVQWVLSYSLSKFSTILLTIGIIGLLTVGLQYIILNSLSNGFNGLNKEFSLASNNFGAAVDSFASDWAQQTNNYLQKEESTINADLFGWVNLTTLGINNTVNYIIEDLNIAMSIFNNTILYKPMETVVYCTIGRKLENIQDGLGWVQNNVVVRLPRVSRTMFHLLNSSIGETSSKDIKQKLNRTLQTIIGNYKKKLKIELYIAIAFLLLWALQVVISLIILLTKILVNRCVHRNISPDSNNPHENSISSVIISKPRPLTSQEKQNYGYPYIDPYERSSNINSAKANDEPLNATMDLEAHPRTSLSTADTAPSHFHQLRSSSLYSTHVPPVLQ